MAPDCGLKGFNLNKSGNYQRVFIDLVRTSAEVIVRGFVAHLSICLAYKNQTKESFEVTYTCPVDSRAAIYSFEAKLDGRNIVARCLEKKKAEETYKKAVKEGRSAIIGEVDEASSDVFHLSLGNLPPGKSSDLILKMVMELPVGVDGSVCFTLPSVFNPRYCPADQPSGPSDPYTASGGNVFPSQSKYTMDVKAEVHGSLKIARIVSQSDPINVTLSDDETNAEVTQDGGFNCDHDWSFLIYYQTPHRPIAIQECGDRSSKNLFKDDLVMLNFFPELPLEAYSPHNELIFLVDRSGSMEGSRIVKAKSTLLLFLKSLPPGCRFNIISFGNTFSSLFESGSERYTQKTLTAAVELQKSMDADMGGTEIYEALKFIYSKELIPGYARQLIMLTDGEVWNLDQIFELISRHANETRVFAVGIGDGASTAFVQGVAEAGRGRHEMVAHEEQLHTKVMGLVSSMLQESVLDLNVTCETEPSQKVSLIPKVPPVIFGGQHLILYARFTPKTVVKSVQVSGRVGDREITCRINIGECKVVHDSNLSLHRLAAKAQIKLWEMESTEGVKEDMIDLSITSGVVCRHTALVGVDQEGQIINVEKRGKNKSFPVEQFRSCNYNKPISSQFNSGFLCGGSNQVYELEFSSFPCRNKAGAGSRSKRCTNIEMLERDGVPQFNFQSTDDEGSDEVDDEGSDEVDDGGFCLANDELMILVSLQNFDGSWTMENCVQAINVPKVELEAISIMPTISEECLATALCLALLELRYSARKSEWHLLAIKGRQYLNSKPFDSSLLISTCMEHLKKLLK